MKKALLLLFVVGFALMSAGCQKKSTDEQLKENTAKEAELVKKSLSEKVEKAEKAIQKELDTLKQ